MFFFIDIPIDSWLTFHIFFFKAPCIKLIVRNMLGIDTNLKFWLKLSAPLVDLEALGITSKAWRLNYIIYILFQLRISSMLDKTFFW